LIHNSANRSAKYSRIKVDQQTKFLLRQAQVTQQLSLVYWQDTLDRFDFNDNRIGYKEI